jgi:hypothetical protein
MTPYFWHLYARTGDPIYPFRWNFLGDIVGEWMRPGPQHPLLLVWRGLFIVVFLSSVVGLLYILKKKPRNYLFYAFVFGNLLLHGIVFGVSAYSRGFEPGYFIDRLIVLEYIFLAMIASVLITSIPYRFRPRIRKIKARTISRALQLTLFVAMICLYVSVASWTFQKYTAANYGLSHGFEMADWVSENYRGGTIISNEMHVNYRLINNGIQPHNVLGSMYGPHNDLMATYLWLVKENITMIIYTGDAIMLLPEISSDTHFYYLDNPLTASVYGVNRTALRSTLGIMEAD